MLGRMRGHRGPREPEGPRGSAGSGGRCWELLERSPGKAARCPQAKGDKVNLQHRSPPDPLCVLSQRREGREKPLGASPAPCRALPAASTHTLGIKDASPARLSHAAGGGSQSYLVSTAGAAFCLHRGREAAPIHALIPANRGTIQSGSSPIQQPPPPSLPPFRLVCCVRLCGAFLALFRVFLKKCFLS